MKYIGLFLLSLIAVPVLCLGLWGIGSVIGIVSLPFHAVSAGVSTAHGVIDKTLNADNALYNYHWFIQQKEDIGAIETKIKIAQDSYDSFVTSAGPHTDWTFEDKTEAARLASVKQGLQSQYQQLVADYNAHSKEADRSIFQDGLIPNILNTSASLLK